MDSLAVEAYVRSVIALTASDEERPPPQKVNLLRAILPPMPQENVELVRRSVEELDPTFARVVGLWDPEIDWRAMRAPRTTSASSKATRQCAATTRSGSTRSTTCALNPRKSSMCRTIG